MSTPSDFAGFARRTIAVRAGRVATCSILSALVAVALFSPSLQAADRDRIFSAGFDPCCRIGGEVTGLTAGSLVLHLHAGSIDADRTIAQNGAYQFIDSVPPGTSYTLGVNPPQPTDLLCTFATPAGVMGASAIDDDDVTCVDAPPETTIDAASEPPNPTPLNSATFQFSSSEAGSTFTCQLDDAPPTSCDGGSQHYAALTNAGHTFSVWATDPGNIPDATPATFTWTVASAAPTIDASPPTPWPVNYFPFAFSGPVAGVSYECSVSGGAYSPCTSPRFATATYDTANTFAVRWFDAKGNRSTANTAYWTPSPGLVLYYPFNADAHNYSVLEYPNAFFTHDGNVAPAIWGGYAGGAAAFAGDATFANAAAPLTSGFSYAVSIWVYNPGSNTTATVWQNIANTSPGCRIGVDASNASASVVCVDAAGTQIGTVAASLPLGWSNLAFQYYGNAGPNAGNVDFYVNGNPAGTLVNPGHVNLFPATQVMKVGMNADILVDELRIYNTAFPSTATLCVAALFGTWDSQQNLCTPATLGMHYAFDAIGPVANRGAWIGILPLDVSEAPSPGVSGGAYAFNAQVATAAGFATNDHYTIDLGMSAWFYDNGGTGRIVDVSCSLGDPDCGGRVGGIYVALNGSAMQTCALTAAQTFCTYLGYSPNAWHQIFLASDEYLDVSSTFKTSGIDIFLDGAYAAHLAINGAGNPWATANSSIKVGSGGFVGYIDEVKLWGANLPLSGSEALCTLGFGSVYDATTGQCQ